MNLPMPLFGAVVVEGGPTPEVYARSLRTLLDAWREAVLADPLTTPAYRDYVSEAVGNARASLDNGASAYLTLILSVAAVFAAEDEETVGVLAWPDDEAEAEVVRRAVQAGEEYFDQNLGEDDGIRL